MCVCKAQTIITSAMVTCEGINNLYVCYDTYNNCHGNTVGGFSTLWFNFYMTVCVCIRYAAIIITIFMLTLLMHSWPYSLYY